MSRGSIEEGSAVFVNETEKNLTFSAASVQNKNFPSPPSVKLISVDGDGSDDGNGNIHVAFTNVTTTGMTIITSAPFTGTITYLCSVKE